MAVDGPRGDDARRRGGGAHPGARVSATLPGTLVLLRHGESSANAAHTFTGLLDVDLTPRGERQARDAAHLIAADGCLPDLVVTSPMIRSRRTTDLVRDELGHGDATIEEDWRLAERDYGCLTGMAKASVVERYGPEAFFGWRRTMDGVPPPATSEQAARWGRAFTDPASELPVPGSGECLRDVIRRVAPCWTRLRGRVRAGEAVLVVGHGNSLRALCTLIDTLTDEEVSTLNLPPGQPLRYDVDGAGALRPRGGRYLDVSSALEAAEQISREGGT